MTAPIEILAETPLPTEHGDFHCIAFRDDEIAPELTHVALVKGEVAGARDLPVRVHSECFTGEVLQSRKCDCRRQLDAAMEYVAGEGRGAIIYLRQEGRGIGLVDKFRAYALQESAGLDTVDANRELGLPDDVREYDAAAHMLRWLGVESVALLTNNPGKIAGLEAHDIVVTRRIPLVVAQSEQARSYLDTKMERMGHLPDEDEPVGGTGS